MSRLPGRGLELCRVTNSEAHALPASALNSDQQLNLAGECHPRIQAADPGAEPLLAGAEADFQLGRLLVPAGIRLVSGGAERWHRPELSAHRVLPPAARHTGAAAG